MFKKRIIKVLFSFLLSINLMGCMFLGVYGSGVDLSENRNVDTFTKIEMDSVSDLNIVIGDTQSIKITADNNLIDLIETTVNNGTLNITNKKQFNSLLGIKIDIVVVDLDSVILDGVGDIVISNISGTDLKLENSGVGELTAKGTVTNLVAKLDGVGDLNLYELICDNINVSSDGVGDIEVYAIKSLSIYLNGVGSVYHKGIETIKITDNGVGSAQYVN